MLGFFLAGSGSARAFLLLSFRNYICIAQLHLKHVKCNFTFMSFFINLVPYNSYFNLLSNWYHILQCSTFGLLSHTLNLIIVFSLFNVVLLFLILSLLFSCVSYTLQKLYMSPFIFCVRACGRWELDYLRIRISWYVFHIVLQGQGFSVMVGICRQGGDAKNSMYGWCIFYLYRFPTYIYSTLTLQPLWYHIFQSSTFGLLSHALFFLRLIYIIVFSCSIWSFLFYSLSLVFVCFVYIAEAVHVTFYLQRSCLWALGIGLSAHSPLFGMISIFSSRGHLERVRVIHAILWLEYVDRVETRRRVCMVGAFFMYTGSLHIYLYSILTLQSLWYHIFSQHVWPTVLRVILLALNLFNCVLSCSLGIIFFFF